MFMIREILGYCIISVIGIVCMAVLYAPVCFLLRKRVPPKKQIACFLFGACVIMVLAATVVVGATGTAAADRSLKIAQTIANIVMFIPLGFMLPTAFRGMRYFWKTALSLTLFSLAIETAQYFTGRSADIDDLMLNASGGILGYLAFFIISKLVRKKRSRKSRRKHNHSV